MIEFQKAPRGPSSDAAMKTEHAKLIEATPDRVDVVLSGSHSLWSDGMSLADYRRYWHSLMSSPWGRENLRFYIWLDERGEILSSFKAYRLSARYAGEELRLMGVGAVFTPVQHRGHGHARSMLLAGLERARVEGCDAALLFSEIDPEYYGRLGFTSLPASGFRLKLAPDERERATGGLKPSDPPRSQLIEVYQSWSATQRFAIQRSHAYWEYILLKKSLAREILGDRAPATLVLAAASKGRTVAYGLAERHRESLRLMEIVSAPGQAHRDQQLWKGLIALAAKLGLRRLEGWWPAGGSALLAIAPDLQPTPRARPGAMVYPLSRRAHAIDWAELADRFWITDSF